MRLPGWRFICAVSRWTRWGQIEHGSHSRKQATLGSLHSARPLDCIQFSMSDYRRQKQVPKAERVRHKEEGKHAVQGARTCQSFPFSKQHESKTGSEAELNPPPLFDSPSYLRSGKLKKKVALITGRGSAMTRLPRFGSRKRRALRLALP